MTAGLWVAFLPTLSELDPRATPADCLEAIRGPYPLNDCPVDPDRDRLDGPYVGGSPEEAIDLALAGVLDYRAAMSIGTAA